MCSFSVCATTMLCMIGFILGILPDVLEAAMARKDVPNTNFQNGDLSMCHTQAEKDQCSFYPCMDQVMGCHGNRYSRALANNLCKAVDENNVFTLKGWIWAKHTNRCILKTLSDEAQDVIPGRCGHVGNRVKSAFVTCAKQYNICDIMWSDRTALKSTLHFGSWMTIVEAASDCSRRLVTRYIYWSLGS